MFQIFHRSCHSQSFSICHASATTLSLSPLFAETVIISGWIADGSCTWRVCLSCEVVMFMVGECVGGGERRDRSIGEGRSASLPAEERWDVEMCGDCSCG